MMTHRLRLERRRLMADAVRRGVPAPDVAAMFGVSKAGVYQAMAEFGVRSPGTVHRARAQARRRIAETMLRCGAPQSDVARRIGVSRQRVSQIKKEMA